MSENLKVPVRGRCFGCRRPMRADDLCDDCERDVRAMGEAYDRAAQFDQERLEAAMADGHPDPGLMDEAAEMAAWDEFLKRLPR